MDSGWNAVDLKQLLLDAQLWYHFSHATCPTSKWDEIISEVDFIAKVAKWLEQQNIPLPVRPWMRSYQLLCVNAMEGPERKRVEPVAMINEPDATDIHLMARDSISCTNALDIDESRRKQDKRPNSLAGSRLYRELSKSTLLPCNLAWSAHFPSSTRLPMLQQLKSASFVPDVGFLLLPFEAHFPLYCASVDSADRFVVDSHDILDWKQNETIVAICYAGVRDNLPCVYMVTKTPAPGFVAAHFHNHLYLLHLQPLEQSISLQQKQEIVIGKSYDRITALTYVETKESLYLSDTGHNCLWRFHEPHKSWTRVGGGKKWASGFVDGNLKHAQFREPRYLTHNKQGYVYVVDSRNKAIRVIHPNCGSVCTIRHPITRAPFTLVPPPIAVHVARSHHNVLHILARDNIFRVVEWWHQSAELCVILQRLLSSLTKTATQTFDDNVILTIADYIYQRDEMNFCRSQILNTVDTDLALESSTKELIWSWFEFHVACDYFHAKHMRESDRIAKIASGDIEIVRLNLTKLYE